MESKIKKIICASTGFYDETVCEKIKSVLKTDFSDIKVMFIPCAISVPTRRGKFFSMLTKHGFKKENITLFEPSHAQDFCGLDIDMIYVCGGNTFLLLDTVKKCNFGDEIKKYIDNGVIYVGASAGAHLISNDTSHVLNFDENNTDLSDFSALGILDTIFFCHYGPSREPYCSDAINSGKNVHKILNGDIEVFELA